MKSLRRRLDGMATRPAGSSLTLVLTLAAASVLAAALDAGEKVAPGPQESQLPRAMHAPMKERPVLRVGIEEGDIRGDDNRVLQAAVDFIAALGGGTVEIGPGRFLMRDSLHLRSNVAVRGRGAKTVLVKAPAAVSRLVLDGDYGEEQITVADPTGFEVGDGVAVWDRNAGGFHVVVARITGRTGSTLAISRPLNSDYMVRADATAATVFPVVSGYHLTGARIEGITVEGDRDHNPHITGCRGGGIFLYRAHGTVISRCTVRGYNGDGISFQQSNDVRVLDCVSEGNASLGLHPGSGSQRPVVRGCIARGNGQDGLFLCWRVRHGVFEKNVLEGNGRFGISIGHKDSDNLLQENVVRDNDRHGIYFRDETYGMAGHRNRLVGNVVENNGRDGGGAGIMIDGETDGVVIEGNVIRDTRPAPQRTQRAGVRIGSRAGEVALEKNTIDADKDIDDLRSRPAGGTTGNSGK